MSKHEQYKSALSRIVSAEKVRHEQRHGRGQWNEMSEARRRLEQAGEEVTRESLESMEDYLRETGD